MSAWKRGSCARSSAARSFRSLPHERGRGKETLRGFEAHALSQAASTEMFFTLSKVLGFFANPSNLVVAFGIAGLVLLATRWARAGAGWLGQALRPGGARPFPYWQCPDHPAGAALPALGQSAGHPTAFLCSAVPSHPTCQSRATRSALDDSAERLTVAAEGLARRYPNARVLFSGGTGALMHDEGSEAPFAQRRTEGLGIARDRILLEDRSRNTIENALYSKQIAQPKPGERWLLVTSAYHLPRAMGVFRKAGFPVEPCPVDWRTRGMEDALRPFPTVGDGLRRADTAMREWVGLASIG